MKIKFGILVTTIALFIAGTAAYFSVFGLSQLFAGASLAIIIMASILEIGKIVTTSLLQRYWSVLNNGIKYYLVSCVIILMLITSGGIYGFLSNAYQKTANKLEIHEGELLVLENKKNSFDEIKKQKISRREQLINLRERQEIRIDSAKTNKVRIRAEKSIDDANVEINKLDKDIDVLSDSINTYNTNILNIKSSSSVASEIGPLKYLSELTGKPMASVVNWFILLLIFVFDPLAVMLVIVANKLMTDKVEIINEPVVINNQNDNIDKELEIEDVVSETNENVINDEITETPVSDVVENNDINNRGFSVNIPNRKYANQIQRIGSNKEIRDGVTNTLFFNKDK